MANDNDNGNGTNSNRPRISAIRPGILVALHVSHEGGRRYDRQRETVETEGAREVADIFTRRTVFDKDEYKSGQEAQNRIRGLFTKGGASAVCIATDFGLLCPL